MRSSAPTPACLRRLACHGAPESSLASLALLAALLLLQGCASPGPPQPPSLHLPEPAKGLAVERVGDRVVLTWMSTGQTTDGDTLRGPLVAVVCRETPTAAQTAALAATPAEKKTKPAPRPIAPAGHRTAQPATAVPTANEATPGPPCNPIQRFEVPRGADRAVELLPPALAAGAPALLGYRVELLNDAGRSDGPTASVYTAAGAAPAPAGTVVLSASRAGVAVRWQARGQSAAKMELSRSLVTAEPGSAADPAAHRRSPGQGSKPLALPARRSRQEDQPHPEPVRLAAEPGEGDSGGMIDPSALNGGTYVYVAQRVRRVTLAGRTVELRGEPSPPATIRFRNRFPPLPVTGLVAVSGFTAAPSIDLSWEPGTDKDLAGYNVYRVDAAHGGTALKLNAKPVVGPGYRDATVVAGVTYSYTVTAVDTLGNESKPSEPVHESFTKP